MTLALVAFILAGVDAFAIMALFIWVADRTWKQDKR